MQKGRQSPSTSSPQSRECAGKATRFAGPQYHAWLQGTNRTDPPELRLRQLALSKRLSKLDRTRPPSPPRQRVRRAGESPSDRTIPPTPSTTDASNRNHERNKVTKAPATSLPQFRECAGKATRFAGSRCNAWPQGARWCRRTPPPRSCDGRCGPAPWRACRPGRVPR